MKFQRMDNGSWGVSNPQTAYKGDIKVLYCFDPKRRTVTANASMDARNYQGEFRSHAVLWTAELTQTEVAAIMAEKGRKDEKDAAFFMEHKLTKPDGCDGIMGAQIVRAVWAASI